MPSASAMDLNGDGLIDHSKPLLPATREHKHTNIEALTSKLESITIKKIGADAKKRKKPKYIDTTKLLRFSRSNS
jgi:hypothetical protein